MYVIFTYTFTIKNQPNVGTYIPYMDGMGYNWTRPAGLVTLWSRLIFLSLYTIRIYSAYPIGIGLIMKISRCSFRRFRNSKKETCSYSLPFRNAISRRGVLGSSNIRRGMNWHITYKSFNLNQLARLVAKSLLKVWFLHQNCNADPPMTITPRRNVTAATTKLQRDRDAKTCRSPLRDEWLRRIVDGHPIGSMGRTVYLPTFVFVWILLYISRYIYIYTSPIYRIPGLPPPLK